MKIEITKLALAFLLLTGCSGTTVVLLRNADGKVGEVDMKTKAGSEVLNKPNETASVSKPDQTPSEPSRLSIQQIYSEYGDVLTQEPAPPIRMPLPFASGVSEISQKDQSYLDEVVAAINKRKSCDISVIGHSDTVGTNQMNEGVSKQRAANVFNALTAMGVPDHCMDQRYYGESDLAVKTPDEVDEPANRRVEVEIR